MLKVLPRDAAGDQDMLEVEVCEDDLGDRLVRCGVKLEWVPDAARLIVEVTGTSRDDVAVEMVVRP